MKKVITLVLALALVLTSVVAIAETHATPNINSFATMKVKYVGGMFNDSTSHVGANNYYEITLSKPVDRLLICWAEKGAEPEELAVDENLQATAIAWGHKYMPGTFQYYATWSTDGGTITLQEKYVGVDIGTSEKIYQPNGVDDKSIIFDEDVCDYDAPTAKVWKKAAPRVIPAADCLDAKGAFDEAKWNKAIEDYVTMYPEYSDLTIIRPVVNGAIVVDGFIQGTDPCPIIRKNHHFQTVIATPDQTAFMTVQGERAVYYNRAGKIVGIEYFDGQF